MEIMKEIKELLTEKAMRKIKNVFNKTSKAFKIYNPPFSRAGSNGANSIQPSTCSGSSEGVSYIYPGKSFWLEDGLVTEESDRPVNLSVKRDVSYSGVNSVYVSSPNVVEDKED